MKRFEKMTREDLENNRIKEINSVEEVLEIISFLYYEECIEVLKKCHNLPIEIIKALVDQAKKESGEMTLEVVLASMQALIN